MLLDLITMEAKRSCILFQPWAEDRPQSRSSSPGPQNELSGPRLHTCHPGTLLLWELTMLYNCMFTCLSLLLDHDSIVLP